MIINDLTPKTHKKMPDYFVSDIGHLKKPLLWRGQGEASNNASPPLNIGLYILLRLLPVNGRVCRSRLSGVWSCQLR